MDYPGQRQKYLKQYPNYLNDIVLNEKLIASVKRFCPTLWEEVQAPSTHAIKSYILLELTNTRESCDHIIKLLKDSKVAKNVELSEDLKQLNTSPGRQTYGDEYDIPVTLVDPNRRKKPNTINYSMTKNPRGKAIIINVVPNEVKLEAFRFEHIFKQLYFAVEMHYCLSTAQIIQELEKVCKDIMAQDPEEMDEGLIVMIITHGGDDMICGKDHPYCSRIPKSDNRYEEAVLDIVPIDVIVDIFAKTNDFEIVKVFFFTCCREVDEEVLGPARKRFTQSTPMREDSTNRNAIVHYSCAKGHETPIGHKSLYTPYGRRLSESIAQYAHNEDLAQIMNRTNQELRRVSSAGDYAPEKKDKSPTHKLFFNPGWFEADLEDDDDDED